MQSIILVLSIINNLCQSQLFVLADARPTESEQEVYILAESALFDAADILADLQIYKGASAEIRQVGLMLLIDFVYSFR